jgi:methyl-accepting chemotaxis protein
VYGGARRVVKKCVGGVAGNLREEARRTGIGIRIWNQLFDSPRAVHDALKIERNDQAQAGKGFAVVANEVKEQAKETAKATEDICHQWNHQPER